jgi:hypothetical protein
MTGTASHREPLRALGGLQLRSWALETSDRRRQDKARKVRAVGWEEEGNNFNHAPNIADYRAHLAMFGNALSPLNFQHPVSLR